MDEDDATDRTPLLQQTFCSSAYDDCLGDVETVACLTGNVSSNEYLRRSFEQACDNDCNAHTESPADIVCIFVVAFDNRAGNILEWSLPSDCNLTGVEFKAMASGSHKVQTDFIYFKREQFYGLACFENMSVDIVEERGARMKSIGVLSASYSSLHQHKPFLKNQVRLLLQHPGHYDDLVNYFEEKKGILSTSFDVCRKNNIPQRNLSLPNMTEAYTHPSGCFSQFINFFEAKIFALWRLALLKKRILFFSSPPIGIVCYRVYSTSCLAAHSVKDIQTQVTKPLFYINIADIELLEEELFYIACTTEKIFESKVHLYDLYIDNKNLKASSSTLQKFLIISHADKMKYNELCRLRSENMSTAYNAQTSSSDEMWFIRYFSKLNNLLFSTLLEVSKTQEKQWTRDHMKKVGLDTTTDIHFIKELAGTYAIDIVVNVDKWHCPSFPLCSCCS